MDAEFGGHRLAWQAIRTSHFLCLFQDFLELAIARDAGPLLVCSNSSRLPASVLLEKVRTHRTASRSFVQLKGFAFGRHIARSSVVPDLIALRTTNNSIFAAGLMDAGLS
ncbi:hypothetical protein IVB45_05355 [Bradyrhizobium sp. 4]|uniref:hypothetical protein n=1 Tax=unclassified Bradyrhizobium TaxID=2631580 RepID=UPI001FFC0CDE|nr:MULTISPECIES: hypothetical protein [unclassified Bradyrhizobium]MCK1403695.1 hypothetical protein [Bradyrhizobium sp. 39]MCK1520183.1 hypothetical protein [Bradyrhizobium sp. 17]MCK1632634.1 hypothetical protein [Bradyrhizobium sp. 162]MCK1746864.1 hypothetical protein [Bradyrhizobium sp. 135]UPJ39007.1 hypothetical protein IVB45_05355 [Bradyrhizobium sp. 4]